MLYYYANIFFFCLRHKIMNNFHHCQIIWQENYELVIKGTKKGASTQTDSLFCYLNLSFFTSYRPFQGCPLASEASPLACQR